MLKTALSKALCVRKILTWGLVAFFCVTALGIFVQRFIEDSAAGKEIFLPGVLLLTLAVLGVFCLSVKIVVKYVKPLRGSGPGE